MKYTCKFCWTQSDERKGKFDKEGYFICCECKKRLASK